MTSARRGRFTPELDRTSLLEDSGQGGSLDYWGLLKKKAAWIVVMAILLVAVVILLSLILDSRERVMTMEQRRLSAVQTATVSGQATISPVAAAPVVTSTAVARGTPTAATEGNETVDTHPVASGKFPGSADGPAIVQWWDGESACGIFRLREGKTFAYDGWGTWWRFASEAVADTRYPVHRAEYFNSNQACNEGEPAE